MIRYGTGEYTVDAAVALLDKMVDMLALWPGLVDQLQGTAEEHVRMLMDRGAAFDKEAEEVRVLYRRIGFYLADRVADSQRPGTLLVAQLEARRTVWRHQAKLALLAARLERTVLEHAQAAGLAAARVVL